MSDEESIKTRLKLRPVAIDTYRENVAYLHRECSVYRAEGFQALAKIRVGCNGKQIEAVLNVVDDVCIVAPDELGLSEQAFQRFGEPAGQLVNVAQAEPPLSMDGVRRKIGGERLDYGDYQAITSDIAKGRYSKMEMAAFLVATGQNGLDRDEVLSLTRAMLETGVRLSWNEPLVADKHCIGGIPGNRTSLLIVPIVAAHGMLIPKTSSRAITSPAGTADTMEVLARTDLAPESLDRLVRMERGCLAWGGTTRLAPVDDMLISVERPLGIDSQGQMVASILSKKLAAGATHLLLDIPVGPTAKVRQMRDAMSLRKLFEYVGDRVGLHLEAVITDGAQPVGRGIGPVLEVRDVMQVLENDPEAPVDLREKSLRLAGRILEFDPDVRGGFGYSIARDILESGRALAKMHRIIDAQGRQERRLEPGRLVFEVRAERAGVVVGIDNFFLAQTARLAGAPMSRGAGVDLLNKLGDTVEEGQPLYRVYAEFPANFEFAREFTRTRSGYNIGDAAFLTKTHMEF
ncbi:glycosyl transferase [Methylococcus capsulatus str. Bath]|uniref:Putative thymidine phosphorylase n=1 Tax=Methylococcus capsulatus (strain ATCC 33009 / NCIMB 11132 / Bath) TaxID=243233 RepID=TYPH_METCA|nr:thymidine phosphorylase family protein [Methylococcus capsulatus]Q607P2.1 RecName: Full=Putative thymidine phosphorylase; AltName: Full=TdRPase [Methylococcus capsulatus str. Bath]AAU92022.1 glycosyl transferase [Methylococcus capsulatus str. Bath]